jgi:hypothetical protein
MKWRVVEPSLGVSVLRKRTVFVDVVFAAQASTLWQEAQTLMMGAAAGLEAVIVCVFDNSV